MSVLSKAGITTQVRWLVAVLVTLFTYPVSANQCLNLLPDDVTAEGLPTICQSRFTGVTNTYSCQDYRSGDSHYRILYRGGVYPKAVIQLNADDSYVLLSAPLFGNPRLRCPLKPPAGIPEHAVHRGLGVCHDDADELVSCSVFEYAAARESQAHRYMTFYTEGGETPVVIDAHIAGDNDDAMVAELAYQIGMSLWDSECCSEQAVAYLAYAYRLFPRAEAYKTAYRRSRAILAIRELGERGTGNAQTSQ